MIHQATYNVKSKQLGSALSKDLYKKYGKRSVRVVEGDSVTIMRGEFGGVSGKISKVSTQKSSVAIEGIKKEKAKGDKFDVYIHTSNLLVTSLNTEDKWRISKLEGKDPKKQPKTEPAKEAESEKDTEETKEVEQVKDENAEQTKEENAEQVKDAEETEQVKEDTKEEEKQVKEDTKETKGAEKKYTKEDEN